MIGMKSMLGAMVNAIEDLLFFFVESERYRLSNVPNCVAV